MWIFWALLSALLVASRRPFEKRLTSHLHHFTYGFWTQIFSLPIVSTALLLGGTFINPLQLGWHFWVPLLAICGALYPLNVFLYTSAIKHGELSKVLPIQSLWPVFSLIPAWLTLGETPGLIASIGVCLTVAGVYALGLKGSRLHHPLQPFREDKSSFYMLCGVMVVTLSGILDKIAIHASNPLTYSFISTVSEVAFFFTAMWVKGLKFGGIHPSLKRLGVVGFLQGATYTTYLLALAVGPIAYVSALRGSNVLMGSMLGIVLFQEKLTKAKILSLVLITAGSLLLTFGS